MTLQPKIEGTPAAEYLRDVEDNGKRLCIVGSHRDYLIDIYKSALSDDDDVMTINSGGGHLGGNEYADYNVSLHSDAEVYGKLIEPFVHPSTTVITLRTGCECKRVDHTVDAEPLGGTSALFACVVGLVLGYKRMFLCGVRLEPGTIWHDEHVVANWKLWKPILQPHLTVMGDSWLSNMYNA